MKKQLRLMSVVILVAVLLSACGTAAEDVEAPAAEESVTEAEVTEPLTIALVYGIQGDAFYITMEKGARAKAEELGVELVADGPSKWDPSVQTPIVDAMIAKEVDALINVPNDPQAMIAPLQRAYDAGMPVITTDQYIGDGDYENGSVTFPLSVIASDNFEGGKIACEALIESIGGEGQIYILTSTANVPSDIARRDGCIAAIDAVEGVTLAGVDYTESSAPIATNQTQAMLQKEPELDAIFGANLFSAQGAAAAIKSAGLEGVVKIASFDAPEQAIVDLRNNVIDMVIAQQPALIGELAVQYAYDALMGNTDSIPAKVNTPFVVITRDNVDTPEAQAAIYKSN
ncbi:MAG TPA: sugar ABC transporter substrate-binding protein [Anaerolineaceae bacterium]|nr:sugar ABC transporter substrate-binding protein [Anaerolineaceae bacterium]